MQRLEMLEHTEYFCGCSSSQPYIKHTAWTVSSISLAPTPADPGRLPVIFSGDATDLMIQASPNGSPDDNAVDP
ncbi:hypothetical protein BVC80_1611g18 [Macleaya cordata]|uniref:Uncharacterized protein n=1 Tax=Macleaya cordata TaxID=56857 RepID=A0A200QE42_MACCD|nr:hypothetical protein BVC80_1611g18 [Macleaya cordata]